MIHIALDFFLNTLSCIASPFSICFKISFSCSIRCGFNRSSLSFYCIPFRSSFICLSFSSTDKYCFCIPLVWCSSCLSFLQMVYIVYPGISSSIYSPLLSYTLPIWLPHLHYFNFCIQYDWCVVRTSRYKVDCFNTCI